MRSAATLRTSLLVQGQVLRALILRDLVVQFGHSRFSFAWLILQPVALIVLISTLWVVKDRLTPQGMPWIVFVTTGYLTWFAFLKTLSSLSTMNASAGGLLMFPHVTHLDVFISRAVVDWAIYSIVFALLTSGSILVGQAGTPANLFGVTLSFWAAWWLAAALGVIAGSVFRLTDLLENIFGLVRRVGLFISGVLFVATAVPDWVLPWISWNPLFHCLEMLREAWWPAYRSPIADPWYVVKVGFFLTAFALLIERATRRREPE